LTTISELSWMTVLSIPSTALTTDATALASCSSARARTIWMKWRSAARSPFLASRASVRALSVRVYRSFQRRNHEPRTPR
jgi:hypothetical protein